MNANECYPCRGTGDVAGRTCPYCGGRGESGESTWDGEEPEREEAPAGVGESSLMGLYARAAVRAALERLLPGWGIFVIELSVRR